MDEFLKFLVGFDPHTILSMIGIVWFFSRDIKSETKSLESKVDSHKENIDVQIAVQSARSDRLYEMFIDLLKERK